MIKAVILDLNGIFLEAEHLSDRMEKEYGVSGNKIWEALKKVLNETRKPGARSFFKLFKPYLKELSLDISEEELFNFWFKGEKINPEVLKLTRELKERGIKIFILSRNFKERTEYYRKNLPKIFNSVDKAYFSWETGLVKPDPEAYKAILEEHNLKSEECVYFDDSEKNVESAERLGINSFIYRNVAQIREKVGEL